LFTLLSDQLSINSVLSALRDHWSLCMVLYC